jgi:nucleoside-diphosphate-sugar epimerase
MSSPFKNVLLVGAGGSIGSVVFEALLAEPTLSVSVLKRESSKAELPAHIPSHTVPDSYPTEALVAAFRGHDVIVNCMTSLSVADQYRLIDAAITAGVRRYVASEYGLNNMRPDAQALNSVFRDKGMVQAYLRSRDREIEWMSISCGMWVKWSYQHDFLGMHHGEHRFTLWDEGEGRFSVTTEENTALALVLALTQFPTETRNRNVLLSEFSVSQRELLAELERQTGATFAVERIDSTTRIPELQAEVAEGNFMATFTLIEAGFATGRYGSLLEEEGEIMTDKLGLHRHTLREVVASALASTA